VDLIYAVASPYPKARECAGFQSGITAGICDRRNGLQYKFVRQKILNGPYPLWLFSNSGRALALPATDAAALWTSAL